MIKNNKGLIKKIGLTSLSLLLIGTSVPTHLLKPIEKILPVSLQNEQLKALTPNTPDEVQLNGGIGYSIILEDDGSVWSFGRNDLGQLGLGDVIDRSQPTRIDPSKFNNEKVIRVETGPTKTVALTENNKVYTWGEGNRTPTKVYESALPILDVEISGQTEINAHSSVHIVSNDGKVLSSGSNYQGAFGIGLSSYGGLGKCTQTYSSSSTDFSNFALLSATIGICESNTSYKFLQSGTEVPLTNIVDLANEPNKRYLMGLDDSNNLYIWGEGKSNFPKKLPNASNLTIDKFEAGKYPVFITSGMLYYYPNINGEPVRITLENSMEKIVEIRSGQDNLLILGETGKLYALGDNTYGQIGNIIPSAGVDWNGKIAKETGIDNVKRIGIGVEHTLLQFNDDKFATLGRNSYGQLATTDENSKTLFIKNPYLTNVKDISSTFYSSFAVTNDDKFYSWGGRTPTERLGRVDNSNLPVIVKDFSTISPIKDLYGAASNHIAGGMLLQNGQFYNFSSSGYKNEIGRTGSVSNPLQLTNSNATINGNNFVLSDASQGSYGGIALSTDNQVYTWGYDWYGLLGMGTRTYEIVLGAKEDGGLNAYQVPILPSNEVYTNVYAGPQVKFVLTESGKVYGWGQNNNKQQGLPASSYVVPTLVNTLPPIKEIAMGEYHTLFLDYQGNVWSTGHNSYGQLGIGNTSTPNIPTKIATLSNVKHIATGDFSSFAILENGDAYSFGDNRYGQLGLGDNIQRNEPRLIPGITDVREIEGGLKHTLLITNTGDLYVTGSDAEGQLGLGQSQVNATPINVAFPPNVSINNLDNQIFTINDTLNVSGEVFTPTLDIPIHLSYYLESQDGKTHQLVKDFITTSNPETYSIPISFTDFGLGAYTLTVKAATDTGVSGQASINFTIQDKINPTASIDLNSIPKWSFIPGTVHLTADDIGGSGYRGYRYAITNSTSKPTAWSAVDSNKTGTISIDKSGTNYLHIETYDNIGNVYYLQSGPYYIDVDPPDFIFNEPAKWQQNNLNLGVTIQEASNLVTKKWLPGAVSMDTVKTTGNAFSTASIPITSNGVYSFYAKDENNQEAYETYTISNINFAPILHSSPTKILVPSNSKANYEISTNSTHDDNGDSVRMVADVNGTVITSTNSNSDAGSNQTSIWNNNFSTISENTLYNGQVYLKDSRDGVSNKLTTQIEVYNPSLSLKSKITGTMDISWAHSKLSQSYRLLRDGEVIYSGTNNAFQDNTNSLSGPHIYTLEVFLDGKYVQVASTNKEDGYNLFETPSSILFPQTTLGNHSPINPTSMDLEYMKYEDFSDTKTAYAISVSITDFTSDSSSFTPQSFVLKNVKKLNRSNLIDKVFPDLYLSDTPIQLVNQTETSTDAYTKLEILKDNIELSLPSDVTLNSQSSEFFQANITWDVILAP
ncbi:hypothetical protein MZM54_00300 [[Brevibacterium] frigoritolerans]|nr:hypothetical protein [Peribacillus frigoritolerans]